MVLFCYINIFYYSYDEEKDLLKKDNLTLQEKINDLKKMNNVS